MTDATFVTSPAKGGHGLGKIADQLYEPTALNEPTNPFYAIVQIQAHGTSSSQLKDGHGQTLKLLVTKCEPVLDPERSGEMAYLLQSLREERTSPDGQGLLPFAFPGQMDKEKATVLMERIETQWTRMGLTGAQGEDHWRQHYGIGDGQEYSYGDRGVPGNYHKSPVAWLSEYANTIGCFAVDEPKDDGPLTEPIDFDEDSLAEPDDDPLAASSEVEEPEAAAAEPPKSRRRGGAKADEQQ